jgi:hypothetical protein|nr:MAG TPA: hypothetical protein [Caudoviricetes sp.]
MRFINKKISESIITLEKIGWKLYRTLNFEDKLRSANYFFENDNIKLVIYTENGIIRTMENFD